MDTSFQSVEPVFLLRRDIPPVDPTSVDNTSERLDGLDICLAAEKVSGKETIYGVQDIRGLLRIYPLSRAARAQLLIEGIQIRGHSLTLHDKNPFILKDSNGEQSTKLWISDIPLSCDDKDIESALVKLGCVLRSSLLLERMRNADGKLTRFVTGRRFVFISVPQKPLERFVKIGGFSAKLYYKEQPKPQKKCQYAHDVYSLAIWLSSAKIKSRAESANYRVINKVMQPAGQFLTLGFRKSFLRVLQQSSQLKWKKQTLQIWLYPLNQKASRTTDGRSLYQMFLPIHLTYLRTTPPCYHHPFIPSPEPRLPRRNPRPHQEEKRTPTERMQK